MTHWTLIRRSLRFHARQHLGVLLGAAVGSAVLIGALLVGDSVRESLREMALMRLGKVHYALSSGDRFFRERLADELDDVVERRYRPNVTGSFAPALSLIGIASGPDGASRANHVNVIGVDARFWQLAPVPPAFAGISDDSIILNRSLADQLKVSVGENVLVRIEKPGSLSKEAPLSPAENSSLAIRLNTARIIADEEFGRFGLKAKQTEPFNAFVNLEMLQAKAALTNRVNLFLRGPISGASYTRELKSHEMFIDSALTIVGRKPMFAKGQTPFPSMPNYKPIAFEDNQQLKMMSWESYFLIRSRWQLADAELELRELPATGELELRTSRVFLDPPVVEAARKAAPDARMLQTYFVNELRAGERATPYSMVTAAGTPLVPAAMQDDEILLNQWLADDLQARPGDAVSLRYFTVGVGRTMEERTNTFRVRAVVPMTAPWADRELMPEFPGVAKAESTSEWDGSLPIDMSRIRTADEEYWKKWRGTPKAFVTVAAGEKMWNNRFGNFTAVRFPVPAGKSSAGFKAAVEKSILANLDPASIGLRFEPVREQALKAAEQSQDFGGLFIGFSFFLIVAALLLMALLFQFGIEQRATEVGTLLALGFTPKQVRRLLLCEGAALAVLGALLGLAGGIAYARAMIHALTTIWRSAVGTSSLQFHATTATLGIGVAASVAVALFTIWLALRKQARQPARVLLAGALECGDKPPHPMGEARKTIWISLVSFVLALGLVGWALAKGETSNAEIFFSAGSLLLIAALAGTSALLTKLDIPETTARLSLVGMAVRNTARRRTRSLATVAMLACGSFLVASIGVFRLDENQNATKSNSGTGGFAFIGEATLPVHHDLNTKAGREFFGLDDKALAGVGVVPFRVREGDDASCLNLNRAQKPRLLGVKPELLAERGAFAFASVAKGLTKEKSWTLLKPSAGRADLLVGQDAQQRVPTNEIPAIADEASILWALGKKIGDTIDYTDERGRVFKVRLVGALANSILQGNLVIDEAEFVKRFPGESGYRMFLVDAPANRLDETSATLTRALRDVGLELTPATRRLAQFNAVQNTYLSTFQLLGGLGLVFGSVGLGVVVLRNVLERRGELALLLAVGFQPRALLRLVLGEHAALLVFGLAGGVLAAAVAVVPTVLSPNAEVPWLSLGLTLGGVLASGLVWTWLATVVALRGNLLAALRNE